MKKILLIGFIIFCIFQMMVMATAIDIGSPAIVRTYGLSSSYLYINLNNAANESGTITEVKIYAGTEMADCQVGTFYLVSGTTYSSRDYETVNNGNGAGVVLAGSEQTFTVDLDVTTGDFIGFNYSAGDGYIDTTGGSGQAYAPTSFPVSSVEFTINATRLFSLYGTGATPSGITWNTITMSKFNTVTCSKWNGM